LILHLPNFYARSYFISLSLRVTVFLPQPNKAAAFCLWPLVCSSATSSANRSVLGISAERISVSPAVNRCWSSVLNSVYDCNEVASSDSSTAANKSGGRSVISLTCVGAAAVNQRHRVCSCGTFPGQGACWRSCYAAGVSC